MYGKIDCQKYSVKKIQLQIGTYSENLVKRSFLDIVKLIILIK